jgi:beta-1,4-N-acetylglucosaminyltransferase
MIFVTVGSSTIPFDRLLRGIDEVSTDERLIVQYGTSTIRPGRADCVDFLNFDEFVELVGGARVVVTHAGVGSLMTALAAGKRPVVVPRRCAFGEAVDDHQVPFARRAGELGLAKLVEEIGTLALAIVECPSDGPVLPSGCSPIEVELRSYIQECIGSETPLAMSERSTAWS